MASAYCRPSPPHRLGVQVSAAAAAADTTPPPFGKGAARRVVITGMGVVSSLGHDPTEFYDNLLAGKSGISLIEGFDACKFKTNYPSINHACLLNLIAAFVLF